MTLMNPLYLKRILGFLEEIGIGYQLTSEPCDSFLRGIKMVNGQLLINTRDLLCSGDILHEAGHIACLPPELRPKASGDIGATLGEQQTYELAVILWSVAAAHHLEIPVSEIFHDEAYLGYSDWFTEQASSNSYVGLPLLQWLGLAASDEELAAGKVQPFPAMKRWLRV